MSYYYFGASLPPISMDTPPALSFTEFCGLCADHLAPRHSRAVGELATPDGPATTPFTQRWQASEYHLRNALVGIRAQRGGRDASAARREAPGVDSTAEQAAADAYTRPDPLERERALDRHRWARAEELAGFDPFSFDAILAYGARLRIAERWAGLDTDKGLQRSQAIVMQEPAPDSK